MEIVIFARFHARPGAENELAHVLATQVARVRQEPGCLEIEAFRALRDPRKFFLRARWVDEPAFDVHVALASTDTFMAQCEALMDHAFDASRTQQMT